MEPGYTFLAKLESVSLKYVNGGNFNDALGETNQQLLRILHQ